MKRSFLSVALAILTILNVPAVADEPPVEEILSPSQLHQMTLAELEMRKKELEARVYYVDREADRLLFLDWLAYRQTIRQSEQMHQEIHILEMKIDALKRKSGQKN